LPAFGVIEREDRNDGDRQAEHEEHRSEYQLATTTTA
jgi:hypothetical protein